MKIFFEDDLHHLGKHWLTYRAQAIPLGPSGIIELGQKKKNINIFFYCPFVYWCHQFCIC